MPDEIAINAKKVERLVSAMMEEAKKGYTVLETYIAARAVGETMFQTLSSGVDDKERFRKLLEGDVL